jgi:DNA-binding NtrC family response regulator
MVRSADARVLIVDDAEAIRMALTLALEDDLSLVKAVETAEEGYALTQSETFDLLIVDRDLPGMSGTDLIRKLKEEGTTCRFLFITGHASPANTMEVMELGIEGFIEKPFDDIFQVADRIKALIEKEKPAGPGASKGLEQPQAPGTPPGGSQKISDLSEVAQNMRRLRDELSARTSDGATGSSSVDVLVAIDAGVEHDAVLGALTRSGCTPRQLKDWPAVAESLRTRPGGLAIFGLELGGERLIDILAKMAPIFESSRVVVVGPQPSVDLLGALINAGVGLFIPEPGKASSRLTSRLSVELRRLSGAV